MKSNNSIKTVVAVGIGAALFFVLGRFVAIPSPVPNTNISLQYAVLALLAVMYRHGSRGTYRIYRSYSDRPFLGRNSMVELGDHFRFRRRDRRSLAKKLNVQEGDFGKGKVTLFAIANIVAHVIGWIVVAPVLDILIYAEPANKVFAQGAFAMPSPYTTTASKSA